MPQKFEIQGRLLRKIREKMGLNQSQMARRLGLDEDPGKQFVSAVEVGKVRLPPRRWRLIGKVAPKDQVLDAYLADEARIWEAKYESR